MTDRATKTGSLDVLNGSIDPRDDYYKEVVLGNIPGETAVGIGGSNPGAVPGVNENIWSNGGEIEFLTTSTQLYASSTSTSDTQVMVIDGVDNVGGIITRVNRLVILNGQNKVAVLGNLFRVYNILNISTTDSNQGDVYFYEDDTVVAGVPQTASKIQAKMLEGTNGEVICNYACPSDKQAYFIQLNGSASKAKDATVFIRSRQNGSVVSIQAFPFEVFQNIISQFGEIGFVIPTGWDVDFQIRTNDEATRVSIFFKIIEKDL